MPLNLTRRVRSLEPRSCLYAGVPVLTLLLVVIVLLGTSSYRDLYAASLFRIDAETLSAAEQIDTWNVETVTVPRVMAAAQENGMFGAREASLAYARHILETYPQFTGAYFGYEPNADGQDADLSPPRDRASRSLPPTRPGDSSRTGSGTSRTAARLCSRRSATWRRVSIIAV